MASIRPFRALRPKAACAARIAAVPYDVVSIEEARQLADGNDLSFLRVSRAEIELATGVDPYSEAVYDRAAANFERLTQRAYEVEQERSLYLYRLAAGGTAQTGIAGCFSLDDYERDIIRKHERTRPDKEDDRTRHMLALGAQTGPVLLAYRSSPAVSSVVDRAAGTTPMFDFEAPDGVRHTIWRVGGADREALVSAFVPLSALYIADGHHRAASAFRARQELRKRSLSNEPMEADTLLAVAFPHDQMRILAYNRVVKDLAGCSATEFLDAVGRQFAIERGEENPGRRGEIAMYFEGAWYRLTPRHAPDPGDPIASLDVSVLQDRLFAPVLNITDVRTDKRIDFVGGSRGPAELKQRVDSGSAVVAFSMFPVSVTELMAVSDAGAIMPPKSTWFEPKLRDGLLIHTI